MTDVAAPSPAARGVPLLARWGATPFHVGCAALVAAYLVAFLIVPVASIVFIAFWDGESRGTKDMIRAFLRHNPKKQLRIVRY